MDRSEFKRLVGEQAAAMREPVTGKEVVICGLTSQLDLNNVTVVSHSGTRPTVIILDEVGVDIEALDNFVNELKEASPMLFGCGRIRLTGNFNDEDAECINAYFEKLHHHQIIAVESVMREARLVVQPKHGPRGKWGKLKSR